MCAKVVINKCKHYFYSIEGKKIDCDNPIFSNDDSGYCKKHYEIKIRGNLIEHDNI